MLLSSCEKGDRNHSSPWCLMAMMTMTIQTFLYLGWTTRAVASRSFPFASTRKLWRGQQWPRRRCSWPSAHGTVLRLRAGVVGGEGGGCGGGFGACWDAHYGRLDFGIVGRKADMMQKRFLDGPKKAPRDCIMEVRGGAADARVSAATRDKTDESNKSSSCTTSSSTSETSMTDPKLYHGVQRQIQRGAAGAILAAGFVLSATRALVTNGGQWKQLKPTVEAFRYFLKKSEINLELSKTLNYRLLYNIVLLSRVQKKLVQGKDIRDSVVVTGATTRAIPPMVEGLRYMKYATAAYGDSMILAADIDAKGQHDIRPGRQTKTRVSQHIGVPENDIVLMDIDYAGDTSHLRHFVAVDHANKKVVLAIRGTFSLSELVVDAASFSTPFCEGEAHSEMANMAQKVWTRAGNTVLQLLDDNDGYDLVLTGHSLGGGVACLMNILCQKNHREMVRGRHVQCITFASPPVFTPLTSARAAVLSCTNYVHENDVVPFLSVDAVRHLFKSIGAIQARPECQTLFSQMPLVTGYRLPSVEFVAEIHRASTERLKAKPGAPLLAIPAASNVWMRERQDNSGDYDFKICDPLGMATLGIQIHLNMLTDHSPPRYEHALQNLEQQEK